MHSSVSIIIPAYNSQEWVADAIESALAQTLPACEVIVVDDGSTDNTTSIVNGFAPKVKLIESAHMGGNHARNLGWKVASGDWLQFLDSDDLLHETKLEGHLSAAINADQHTLTFAPARVVDFNSGRERYTSRHEKDAHPLERIMFELNSPTMPLYSRATMESVNGFRENLSNCQDRDLHLRLWLKGYCLEPFSTTPLVTIRKRRGSVSFIQPACDLNYIDVYRPLLDRIQRKLATPEESRLAARLFSTTARRLARFGYFKAGSKYDRLASELDPEEAAAAYGRLTGLVRRVGGFVPANLASRILARIKVLGARNAVCQV